MLFPVSLNLKGKRVVVIGGGEVAERKVMSLAETGASITVISPNVTPQLSLLARDHSIELHRRPYLPGDCKNAVLVLSATDDPETSRAVWEEANRAGAGVVSLGRSFAVVAGNRGIKTAAIYRFVRHPMYAAYMLGSLGYVACFPSTRNLVITAAALITLYLRARAEERFLVQDPAYQDYQRRVPWRFVPYVY